MLILSNPFLLLLLWEPNVVRMSRLERGDEGGYGSVRTPSGTESLVNDDSFFELVQTYPFSTAFFWGCVVGNFPNLKGCMFVYVPYKTSHKFSVKGTLGVGEGGEE